MEPQHIKRIGLIVAVIAAATLTWWTSHAWLTQEHPFTDTGTMLPPALAIVALAAVAGIAFVLLESRLDRVAAILASWATFIIFWTPDIWYVSALPVFLVLWYEASRRIRNDVGDRRRVRIATTLGSGLQMVLLGVYVMISVGFYLLPEYRTANVNDISRGVQGSLESAYDSPIVREQLSQLPPTVQAQFKSDTARSVDRFIHQWLGPIAGFLPPLLAFALFLALWSVSFIFREVALWSGRGIWALLRATRFITVAEEEGRLEVVRL